MSHDTPIETLTARQQEVAALVADGLTVKEIARKLGCGAKTVGTHITEIHRRLGVHGIAGVTRWVIRVGLREP